MWKREIAHGPSLTRFPIFRNELPSKLIPFELPLRIGKSPSGQNSLTVMVATTLGSEANVGRRAVIRSKSGGARAKARLRLFARKEGLDDNID
jgi:hypothetical protein